jgi:hypothetical protein
MSFLGFASPLGGVLGATCCSIYKIDATTGLAFEPLPDIVPGYSPLRVTIDVTDSESTSYSYSVTSHAIQSFLDITSNVHKNLERVTISGYLGGLGPMMPLNAGQFGPLADIPGEFLAAGSLLSSLGPQIRLDLMRYKNLKAIADSKSPVMVITPQIALAKAFITDLSHNWDPDSGQGIQVSISFVEARFVSPATGDLLVPDYAEQGPGNNETTGGGQSQAVDVGASAGVEGSSGSFEAGADPVPPS